MSKSEPMKPSALVLFPAFFALAVLPSVASGQTSAATPAKPNETTDLQVLARKIDEQTAKIDTLSQQILKLEQQLSNMRPGVMIGEGGPTTSTSTPSTEAPRPSANANSHIVARGETLTSIAKMHGVSVSELQKYNHIDNPLKLQAGQTILIPTSPTPAPSASSSGE